MAAAAVWAIAAAVPAAADPGADPGDVQTLTPPPPRPSTPALDAQFLGDLTNCRDADYRCPCRH
jgi:hypothetical protein